MRRADREHASSSFHTGSSRRVVVASSALFTVTITNSGDSSNLLSGVSLWLSFS
jgi:hypothetical protein